MARLIKMPDGSSYRFPDDATDDEIVKFLTPRYDKHVAPQPAEPAPPPGGVGRNIAAGANSGIAGFLGLPGDVASAIGAPGAWAASALSKHVIDPLIGRERTDEQRAETFRQSTELPGGSASIERGLDALGLATAGNTSANTADDRVARSVGGMLPAVLGPHAAARTALGEAVAATGPIARALQGGLAAGSIPQQTGVAIGAGLGGGLAAETTDGPWQPLARMGGEMLGGAAAIGAQIPMAAAKRSVADSFAPFTATGRERIIGQELADAVKTPANALRHKLENVDDGLPGSAPTTAQAAGDMELLTLERGASRSSPQAAAAFINRNAEQEAARRGAIEGIAPDGKPYRVGEHIASERARITSEFDQRLATAQQDAERALRGMGGDLDPHQYGTAMRGLLETAKTAERNAVSRLYAQVDPDETLVIDIAPLKSAMKDALGGLPKAARFNADEGRLMTVIQNMPNVEKFSEITALRSELTSAMRAERAGAGETPAYRRMTMMLKSVDDQLDTVGQAGGGGSPDPDALTRYRVANDQHKAFSQTYRAGAVGEALRPEAAGIPRVRDSDLPAKFFHGGKRSREDVSDYIAAVGDREEAVDLLFDYAASSLRRAAVKDGKFDQRAWLRWRAQNSDAISALEAVAPGRGLTKKLTSVAGAAKSAELAGSARQDVLHAMERDTARLWAEDAEPIDALAKALGSDATSKMGRIAAKIHGNQEAKEGLQKTIGDYILREFRSHIQVGDIQEPIWKAEMFQKWLDKKKPALRFVLTGDQIKSIEMVAKDLQRSQRTVSGSRLPGGSDSVQNYKSVPGLFGRSAKWAPAIGAVAGGGVGNFGGSVIGAAAGVAAEKVVAQAAAKLAETRIRALLDPRFAAKTLDEAMAHQAGRPPLLQRAGRQMMGLGLEVGLTPQDQGGPIRLDEIRVTAPPR